MIRVVLIEDDPEQSRYACEAIGGRPDVRVAGTFGSGAEALAGLAVSRADLVLVDIGLPDLSGIEVVRRLKPAMPAVQFMMLTVIEDVPKVFAALAAGATGYLLKKDIPMRLLDSIRELASGGSPMSGSIARQVVLAFQKSAAGGAPAAPEAAGDGVDAVDGVDGALTAREREILDLLAAGRLYKEIADRLGIGRGTVNTHIRHIYEKLHAHSRWEAVRNSAGRR